MSTTVVQVLSRVMAAFTGVMLAGFVALAYIEVIYVPSLTPGSMTSTVGLWQLAVASVVGGAASVALAIQARHSADQPARTSAAQPAQPAGLPS
jgi:hypothetical protein